MRTTIIFVGWISAMLFLLSCKKEETGKLKEPLQPQPAAQAEAVQPTLAQKGAREAKMSNEAKPSDGKRRYKFPSMMVKEDMYYCEKENDYNCTPLLRSLVVNKWKVSGDKYGRNFIYTSPEISYLELQEYLHFNDSDVTYIKNPKPGEPQTLIQAEWLTCRITFLDKIYDGKDRSVRLKAVLINNEVQANSYKEAEYDKNKGFIRKILDMFEVVHK